MKRSTYILLGIVGAAAAVGSFAFQGSLNWIGTSTRAAPSPAQPFAMPVPVTKVSRKTLPVVLTYSARAEAIQSVTLQAKVTGYLLEQNAIDGSDVNKGDLLYKIDARDYQAALDQVRAQLQRDTAALDYANKNLERGNTLGRDGYLAKDTVDQRLSTVRQAEGSVALDKAAIEAAQLNLSNVEIRAPFSGRLGRNLASVGTLISSAGVALNTIQQISPLYITFNPSERDLADILKARAAGEVRATVYLPDSEAPVDSGALSFLDNTLDRSTGTIIARATIANSAKTLLPGQYVRVRIHIGEHPDALMVPQAALGSSQLGKYVYVVDRDSKVEQRTVTLGNADGTLVEVLNGVSAGDSVISGNLQKIGPGSLVRPIAP